MNTHDADFFFSMAMTEQRDAMQAEIDVNKRVEAYVEINQRLIGEVAQLRAEVEAMRTQDKVRVAQIAGLTAELNAYVNEADTCAHKDGHHGIAAAKVFVNPLNGATENGRVSREIYRSAFDRKAEELGLEDYQSLRR